MGVPRAHSTRGQKGRRRSHLALTSSAFTVCVQCKKTIRQHSLCGHCGFYKGREVVPVLARELKKKEKKTKRSGR